MRRLSARLVRSFGIIALFLVAALLGTASGVLFAFVGDLPQISALDDYAPATITKVLGRDGSVVGEFAIERRQVVTYDQIPVNLRNAIISAEDAGFFKHGGVDVFRIFATAARRLVGVQRKGGASTITQQLTRKLFLTDDETLERKIKEALLAMQIEKRYTKQEIFTMYCNKMYWGHGAYGVEAASQLYFSKHVGDDRGHSPGQRPREPVREHESRGHAPQLRARPHGRQRLHQDDRSRGHQETADRRPRRAESVAVHRAVFRRDRAPAS
jgi:penicillin-binding protein 1A